MSAGDSLLNYINYEKFTTDFFVRFVNFGECFRAVEGREDFRRDSVGDERAGDGVERR